MFWRDFLPFSQDGRGIFLPSSALCSFWLWTCTIMCWINFYHLTQSYEYIESRFEGQNLFVGIFPAPMFSIWSFSSSIQPASIKGASSEELSVDGVFRQDVTSEWVWISLENCFSHLQMPKSHHPQNCEKGLLNRQALHRYSESNLSQLVLHWVIIRVFAFCNINIEIRVKMCCFAVFQPSRRRNAQIQAQIWSVWSILCTSDQIMPPTWSQE